MWSSQETALNFSHVTQELVARRVSWSENPMVTEVLVAILGTGAACLAGTAYVRSRSRRLAEQRAGLGYDDFRQSFGPDVPEEVVAAVYACIENQLRLGFPVLAADSLSDVLGTVDEDLDEMILALMKKLGRRPPPLEEQRRVETVGDVVHLLASAPST